jgi:hypothetical protein
MTLISLAPLTTAPNNGVTAHKVIGRASRDDLVSRYGSSTVTVTLGKSVRVKVTA